MDLARAHVDAMRKIGADADLVGQLEKAIRDSELRVKERDLMASDVVYLLGDDDGNMELHVIMNDVWAKAVSDSCQITDDQIDEVHKLYMDGGVEAVIRWGCKQNGVEPMPEAIEQIREHAKRSQ